MVAMTGPRQFNTWSIFAPGEALFLGGEGGEDEQNWVDVTYHFAARPNEMNLRVGNINWRVASEVGTTSGSSMVKRLSAIASCKFLKRPTSNRFTPKRTLTHWGSSNGEARSTRRETQYHGSGIQPSAGGRRCHRSRSSLGWRRKPHPRSRRCHRSRSLPKCDHCAHRWNRRF
jgi:hypothetical protein